MQVQLSWSWGAISSPTTSAKVIISVTSLVSQTTSSASTAEIQLLMILAFVTVHPSVVPGQAGAGHTTSSGSNLVEQTSHVQIRFGVVLATSEI